MLICSFVHQHRDALIQVCIIFPAEPATLLEHLPRLVRGPLLLALASTDNEGLLKIGLEYLDGWIDHLGVAEMAARVGAATMCELSATLASHLGPAAGGAPISHATRAHGGGDEEGNMINHVAGGGFCSTWCSVIGC